MGRRMLQDMRWDKVIPRRLSNPQKEDSEASPSEPPAGPEEIRPQLPPRETEEP